MPITGTNREGTAEAYIENGLIKISVSLKSLRQVIQAGVDGGHLPVFADRDVRIVDVKQFAADVVNALNDEREDGTTPIHLLFDAAFEKAVEDGSLGVEVLFKAKG